MTRALKLVSALAIVLMLGSNFAYGQKELQKDQLTLNKDLLITGDEYNSLDADSKRLVDLLNTANGALQAYSVNGSVSKSDAFISYSLSTGDKMGNMVLLQPSLPNDVTIVTTGSCKACGVSSAIGCAKQIRQYMQRNGISEIDLHVSVGGGCGTVTW